MVTMIKNTKFSIPMIIVIIRIIIINIELGSRTLKSLLIEIASFFLLTHF